MLSLLCKAVRDGTPQAVCCQLAYSTTSRAFELLCALSEERGLVFVNSMTAKVGAVFYDRDPTWQNEIVSGTLAQEVCAQLVRTGAACLGFITLVALYVTAYPEPRLHIQSVARCTLAASKAALAKQGA